MCGIAGYATGQRTDGLAAAVATMMAALARRGPDSEGTAEWPGVVLGHRRLAILDLSAAGHQPMISEDGRVGLVFNGCIDSHHVLIDGTPELVQTRTRETLDIMKPGGGYIVSASHDYILEETPVENVVEMFDTVAEFGVYGGL